MKKGKDFTVQLKVPEDTYKKWKVFLRQSGVPLDNNIKRLNSAGLQYAMNHFMKNPDSFRDFIQTIKLYREC